MFDILKVYGEARTVSLKRYAFEPHQNRWADSPEASYEFELAKDGRTLVYRIQNPDGSTLSVQNEYDEYGRLATAIVEPSFSEQRRIEHRYDPSSPLVMARFVHPSWLGNLGLVTEFGLDHLKEHHLIEQGISLISTTYDQAIRQSETRAYDRAERQLVRAVHTYDPHGRVVHESLSFAKPALSNFLGGGLNISPEQGEKMRELISLVLRMGFETAFSYDAASHCIEIAQQQAGGAGRNRIVRRYDQHGDLLEQTTYASPPVGIDVESVGHDHLVDALASLPFQPEHMTSEARYVYEYDVKGSWTTRITTVRTRVDERLLPSIKELRQIVYF